MGDIEEEAEDAYKFYIEMILYFQDKFGYNGDIGALLQLPYCIFQDLIIERSKKMQQQQQKDRGTIPLGGR